MNNLASILFFLLLSKNFAEPLKEARRALGFRGTSVEKQWPTTRSCHETGPARNPHSVTCLFQILLFSAATDVAQMSIFGFSHLFSLLLVSILASRKCIIPLGKTLKSLSILLAGLSIFFFVPFWYRPILQSPCRLNNVSYIFWSSVLLPFL